MFRKSATVKHSESIHKLLSNGYRYAIMANGAIREPFRFEYEAMRHKRRGESIVAIQSLL